jgi:hypothetical protein
VATLIECQDHVTASCELDRESVLGFTRIEISVDRQDARGRCSARGVWRDVEEGAQLHSTGPCKADIQDADSTARLDEVGEKSARQDQCHGEPQHPPSGPQAPFFSQSRHRYSHACRHRRRFPPRPNVISRYASTGGREIAITIDQGLATCAAENRRRRSAASWDPHRPRSIPLRRSRIISLPGVSSS